LKAVRCAKHEEFDVNGVTPVESYCGGRRMRHCKLALKWRDSLCDGTTGLYFEKPKGFEFKPGQFANFTLDSVITTDAGGITRSLSIASAPHEKDLMVAMRMRDTGFKRIASALPIGSSFLIDGPYGDLVLHRDVTRPSVFLAGGIGITPFRSMIRHATEGGGGREILLFYSVRRLEEAAFMDELQEIQGLNRGFEFIPTITHPEGIPRHWRGEVGHITEAMLRSWIPDFEDPIFYVAGPPGMVAGMREMLAVAGAPDDNIRAEEFAGY
jgi:ferredoxin-NADP reductase